MKPLIAIVLLLVMSIRSVLPLIDYAVNYHYISTQLCENKNKPELLCNGKCYVKKELAKSSQNTSAKELKIQIFDITIPEENILLSTINKEVAERKTISYHFNFHFQSYYKEFFHPPLV